MAALNLSQTEQIDLIQVQLPWFVPTISKSMIYFFIQKILKLYLADKRFVLDYLTAAEPINKYCVKCRFSSPLVY